MKYIWKDRKRYFGLPISLPDTLSLRIAFFWKLDCST